MKENKNLAGGHASYFFGLKLINWAFPYLEEWKEVDTLSLWIIERQELSDYTTVIYDQYLTQYVYLRCFYYFLAFSFLTTTKNGSSRSPHFCMDSDLGEVKS